MRLRWPHPACIRRRSSRPSCTPGPWHLYLQQPQQASGAIQAAGCLCVVKLSMGESKQDPQQMLPDASVLGESLALCRVNHCRPRVCRSAACLTTAPARARQMQAQAQGGHPSITNSPVYMLPGLQRSDRDLLAAGLLPQHPPGFQDWATHLGTCLPQQQLLPQPM